MRRKVSASDSLNSVTGKVPVKLSWLEPFGSVPDSGPFADLMRQVAAAARLSPEEAAKVVWSANPQRWMEDPNVRPAQAWHVWRGAEGYSKTLVAELGIEV